MVAVLFINVVVMPSSSLIWEKVEKKGVGDGKSLEKSMEFYF